MDSEELVARLEGRALLVAHRLVVHGATTEDEGPLLSWFEPPTEGLLRVNASDQTALVSELRARKGSSERGLQPLADQLQDWVDQGLRVFLVGRTQHQADRLTDLLRGYDVPTEVLDNTVLGELRDGFILWSEGLAFVTEEEIFGARVRQRRTKRASRRQQQQIGRAHV